MALLSRKKQNTETGTAEAPADVASLLDALRSAHIEQLALQSEAIALPGRIEAARAREDIDAIISLEERAEALPALIYAQRIRMLKLQAKIASMVAAPLEEELAQALSESEEIERRHQQLRIERSIAHGKAGDARRKAENARSLEQKATSRSMAVFSLLSGGEDAAGIWGQPERQVGVVAAPAIELHRIVHCIEVMLTQVDSLKVSAELAGIVYGPNDPAVRNTIQIAADTRKQLAILRTHAKYATLYAEGRLPEMGEGHMWSEYTTAEEAALLSRELAVIAEAVRIAHKTGLSSLTNLDLVASLQHKDVKRKERKNKPEEETQYRILNQNPATLGGWRGEGYA